jgi:hypothetical protein
MPIFILYHIIDVTSSNFKSKYENHLAHIYDQYIFIRAYE